MVHEYVSRLRTALGDASRIETRVPGYLRHLRRRRARRAPVLRARGDGSHGRERGRSRGGAALYEQALGLWRGDALAGVELEGAAQIDAARLDQERRLVGRGAHRQRARAGPAPGADPGARAPSRRGAAARAPARAAHARALPRRTPDRRARALSRRPSAARRAGRHRAGARAPRARASDPAAGSGTRARAGDARPTSDQRASPRRAPRLDGDWPSSRASCSRRPSRSSSSCVGHSGFRQRSRVSTPTRRERSIPATTGSWTRCGSEPGPGRIAAGFGSLWVVNEFDNTVSRIDPATGTVRGDDPGRRRSDRDRGGSGLRLGRVHAAREASIGSTRGQQTHPARDGRERPERHRDQPRSGVGDQPARRHRDRDRLDDRQGPSDARGRAEPERLAYGLGALWIANESSSTVTRLDPRPGGSRRFAVGNGPEAVTIGYGSVWVANSLDGTVWRIDPTSDVVTTVITVGPGPSSVLASDGAIWVADSYGGEVVRIDPATNRIIATITVGSGPQSLASIDGRIWLSARETAAVHRGGTLRLCFDFAPTRLDRLGLNESRRLVGVLCDQRRSRRVQARGGPGRRNLSPTSRPRCRARPTGPHLHVPPAPRHPLLERRSRTRERPAPRARARLPARGPRSATSAAHRGERLLEVALRPLPWGRRPTTGRGPSSCTFARPTRSSSTSSRYRRLSRCRPGSR